MSPDTNKTLVVDLDGTLLRSDMLYESLWSFFRCNWRRSISIIKALYAGKAALKRFLATHSAVNVLTLPYDPYVISFVESWKNKGGYAILVTASDHIYAQAIANHLGIFDEAYGSDGVENLKGERKRKFIEERFGRKGFAYMADNHSDLPVWKHAFEAITVNASKSLRRKVEDNNEHTRHLITTAVSIKSYVKALRPHQWLKNMLIFLPLIAAHQFNTHAIAQSILAFVSFSLVASSVYIVNDLLDLSDDRMHPRKKKRPFAAGKVPIGIGTKIAIILIIFGFISASYVGTNFLLLILAYYIVTKMYSIYFKKRIIIDIFILAGLYTIRIVAGGVATQILLSEWLLAFSMFFFFSLAAVKRLAELVDNSNRGNLKVTGRGYHVDDLPIVSMIAIGSGYISILVLALYINSPIVAQLYRSPQALWGVCVTFLFWITNTIMIAYRGKMHDDPVIYAAKDPVSRLCFLIAIIFILYGAIF